jgi:hypothetical protein
MMVLYLHSPTHLLAMVLNELSAGTALICGLIMRVVSYIADHASPHRVEGLKARLAV